MAYFGNISVIVGNISKGKILILRSICKTQRLQQSHILALLGKG